MATNEVVVDGRGRTSLAKVRSHDYDRYLVEELPDGTLVLTPAVTVSQRDARKPARPAHSYQRPALHRLRAPRRSRWSAARDSGRRRPAPVLRLVPGDRAAGLAAADGAVTAACRIGQRAGTGHTVTRT